MGVSVAVNVLGAYETFAGTKVPEESLRKKVVPVMLAAAMASLKVTLTEVPKLAPVVPFTGVTD